MNLRGVERSPRHFRRCPVLNSAVLRSLCAGSLGVLAAACAGSSEPGLEEAFVDEDQEETDTGSLPPPTVIAAGEEFPSDIEIDASNAFWVIAPNFAQDPGAVRVASK